jgi:hypothetical protein
MFFYSYDLRSLSLVYAAEIHPVWNSLTLWTTAAPSERLTSTQPPKKFLASHKPLFLRSSTTCLYPESDESISHPHIINTWKSTESVRNVAFYHNCIFSVLYQSVRRVLPHTQDAVIMALISCTLCGVSQSQFDIPHKTQSLKALPMTYSRLTLSLSLKYCLKGWRLTCFMNFSNLSCVLHVLPNCSSFI